MTGIWAGRWHAVEQIHPRRAGELREWGTALCGDVVTVSRHGMFVPDRWVGRECHRCVWTWAIRTDTLADRYAHLSALATLDTPAAGQAALFTAWSLAAQVAQAVVAAQTGPAADYELDHPYTVAVLAMVSAHAPLALIAADCAEGGCGHDVEDGSGCPSVGSACRACSLVSGGWAGEWADRFLPEATIGAPCAVLRALAGHYGIGVPR